MVRSIRRLAALGLLLLLPALAACNEEEQGRALHTEKGTYRGPADTPLTDAQKDALRQRGQSQKY